ncbi:glycosyltransferase family 71 protein [Atractiella rhizophila]|nr:glycosyltransferase family 71 protein [Atractiella rhizophila]
MTSKRLLPLLLPILLFSASLLFLSPRSIHLPLSSPLSSRPFSTETTLSSSLSPSDLRSELWQSPTPPLPLHATLDERLQSWIDAPLAEPSDMVAWHAQTCSSKLLHKNMNKVQLENSHILWSALNRSTLLSLRYELADHLRSERKRIEGEEYHGQGRGLVFTAGNADTFSRVLLTLRILNDTAKEGQSLPPAEIFSFPNEVPSEDVALSLSEMGATLRTLPLVKDKKKRKNYHMKASSILHSSFRQVLYLDSDNPPADLSALLDLWDSKAYKRLGALFWPDYWKTGADNPIWSIIGTQCRDEWEMEAGQILIDKGQHYDALVLTEYMLVNHEFWYNFTDGDKDAFRYAFLALRKRWAVPGRYVAAGALPFDAMSGFCGHTMLQHDHFGKPLFVHQNLLKQIPSGVGRGAAWGRSRSLKTFSSNTTLLFAPSPSSSFPSSSSLLDVSETLEEDEDMDVDADHLANADGDGRGIVRHKRLGVRRRAAGERGVKNFFHGGWISALCIDIEWKDPELLIRGEDEGDVGEEEKKRRKERSPIEVRMWKDDRRLEGFEERFFRLGGSVNGKGF